MLSSTVYRPQTTSRGCDGVAALTQGDEVVHEGKKATDSGSSPHICQYLLGFNTCQTLMLIRSFIQFLLNTSDCGECSEINGRKGLAMKTLLLE